ncbi:MAG TPA: GNAT family N-acetyltransferase [Thermomicrobiales bacterium]|nr:GNAT family N-acetyltransferase [Thermomicrobiales bacterium]
MSQSLNRSPAAVLLRAVEDADLPILYEHQRDPEAAAMAAFPSRDWAAFTSHWDRIRANPSVINRTILVDGAVAGSIASFEQDGLREVGYWLDRQQWGRGVATRALTAFLSVDRARPLHAHVVKHNIGSIRVLQKCGFSVTSASTGPDGLEELLLTLPA